MPTSKDKKELRSISDRMSPMLRSISDADKAKSGISQGNDSVYQQKSEITFEGIDIDAYQREESKWYKWVRKMKQTFFLVNQTVKNNAIEAIRNAPEHFICEIRPKTRSIEQNARMWAMLGDISEQVDWYGNKLSSNEWKDVFSASLKNQKVVPGIEGGFVVCGLSTSKMTISEMGELMELMQAFGADKEVKFKEREYD